MKYSEFPYYKPDIKETDKKFKSLFQKFAAANSFEEQNKIFLEIKELEREIDTMFSIARTRFTTDVNNKTFLEDKEFFNNISSEYSSIIKDFFSLLCESPFRENYVKAYGHNLLLKADAEIKLFTEEISDDLRDEIDLIYQYSVLRAKAVYNFEGKELMHSEITPFLDSTSREIRKKANEAHWKFFEDNKAEFDRLLDEIIKIRTIIAKKLGFKNFVELGYARLYKEYTEKESAKFRTSIKKYMVPLNVELTERQAKRIGVDKLKYYDNALKFKNGNPFPKGDTEWIMKQCVNMYSELSPETKEFINFMTENELMDLYPKKGKEDGGYCGFFSKYKSPFIFANMNGTASDIDVITHEAGHALQNYLCRNSIIDEHRHTSSETGETHSMSMEFLTYNYMKVFFKEDTNKFYFDHQTTFVKGCIGSAMVDEFQAIIYSNPELTPAERNKVWTDLRVQYNPELDYDGNKFLEEGNSWKIRSLIFENPFYDLGYALAQFGAYQFLFKYQINPEKTFKEYLDFCRLGGRYNFFETLEKAGLKNPFEEETIKDLSQKVKDFMNDIDDSDF